MFSYGQAMRWLIKLLLKVPSNRIVNNLIKLITYNTNIDSLVTKGGWRIKVASNDRELLLLRTLVVLGQYEKPLLNLLRGMVGLGDVVIDVGANEGYISIPLALKVGEQGHVYSIEPHPANVATLKENIGLNNLTNVTVIPKAVSDEKGIMTFYGDRAWGTLINSHMTGESKTEVDLLDNIIQVPVKLVKIDVEGNEIRVIREAKNLIQTFKPIVVFEVSNVRLDSCM